MANRSHFIRCAGALTMMFGMATFIEAASDAAYTGRTNNVTVHSPHQ